MNDYPYITPTFYRNKGDALPHVVWQLSKRKSLVSDNILDALAHVWNRFQCVIDGHDDMLWHLAQAGCPEPPECFKCGAPLTRCTDPKAHAVGV